MCDWFWRWLGWRKEWADFRRGDRRLTYVLWKAEDVPMPGIRDIFLTMREGGWQLEDFDDGNPLT